MSKFMEGVDDCWHRWKGIQWTEPGELKLPRTPFDSCQDCGVKVWGGAIDAPPQKGFGLADRGTVFER